LVLSSVGLNLFAKINEAPVAIIRVDWVNMCPTLSAASFIKQEAAIANKNDNVPVSITWHPAMAVILVFPFISENASANEKCL